MQDQPRYSSSTPTFPALPVDALRASGENETWAECRRATATALIYLLSRLLKQRSTDIKSERCACALCDTHPPAPAPPTDPSRCLPRRWQRPTCPIAAGFLRL